mmetsp:Transcript_133468/g.243247  ORF Transcript_133468/g.243247 Transcript_133468/m.243247 type:complete len:158 (-) Transcript_133468:2852-3325(-)
MQIFTRQSTVSINAQEFRYFKVKQTVHLLIAMCDFGNMYKTIVPKPRENSIQNDKMQKPATRTRSPNADVARRNGNRHKTPVAGKFCVFGCGTIRNGTTLAKLMMMLKKTFEKLQIALQAKMGEKQKLRIFSLTNDGRLKTNMIKIKIAGIIFKIMT